MSRVFAAAPNARGVSQVWFIGAATGTPGTGVRRRRWRASPAARSDRTKRTISATFRRNVVRLDPASSKRGVRRSAVHPCPSVGRPELRREVVGSTPQGNAHLVTRPVIQS